ncbi:unnamed protein product [Adineta steineri]|uniref:Uncharacterized protein n=2 Tax=Adineta steineri TaxID=433720 RepID=A0A813WW61_9BILA|nr:unnamed protein product [Adineta steineri]CAF3888787.1 unnamed protein product [Adineta steineri]
MRSTLIILSLIVFFGIINGTKKRSLSIINADVNELFVLIKKLWSVSSDELKTANKRMCQIMIECCSSKTYSKILLGTISAAMNTSDPFIKARDVCIASPIRADLVKTCPPAIPLNTSYSLPSKAAVDTNIYEKYQVAVEESIKHIVVFSDFNTKMAHICNSKEIYAYLCTLNSKLSKSCIKKILKNSYQSHSKKAYHIYVKKLKRVMTTMYQIMSEF